MKEGCLCQECRGIYKVDLLIPDELWERIKPENKIKGAGLLCPKCIGEKLIDLDEYLTFRLERL